MADVKKLKELLEEAAAVIANCLDFGGIDGTDAAHAEAVVEDIEATLQEMASETKPKARP